MSRITIAKDEQLLVDVRPHAKILTLPIAILFGLCLSSGILIGLAYGSPLDHKLQNYLVDAIVLITSLIGLKTVILPITTWFSTRFIATDHRIIFTRGIIKNSGIDIPLDYVSRFTYQQKFTERLFSSGSLIVESYAEEPILFTDVPKIREIHHMIYEELYR